MQMVVLNRVGDDAKAFGVTLVGARDCQANGWLDELGAQRAKPGPQSDMNRTAIVVLGSGTMRNGRTPGSTLASRARPLAPPGPWGGQTKRELLWPTVAAGHSITVAGAQVRGGIRRGHLIGLT